MNIALLADRVFEDFMKGWPQFGAFDLGVPATFAADTVSPPPLHGPQRSSSRDSAAESASAASSSRSSTTGIAGATFPFLPTARRASSRKPACRP